MTIKSNSDNDAESNKAQNYFTLFNELFNGKVQKNLLRWCIYSITQNDPAHDLNHVYHVCKTGLEIFYHYADIYNFSERDELIVMHACLMHDLGCKYNRRDHHLIGYGLVYEYMSSQCPGLFTPNELGDIAKCVLEHRSSNKKKPTTILSEIVSVADSGKPDMNVYIKRAVVFRLADKNNNNMSLKNIEDESINHLREKFYPDGYHWNSYPDLGKRWYKDDWEVFKQLLKDKPYLRSIARRHIEEYLANHMRAC